MNRQFIDVSEYQGGVDWRKASEVIVGAICKVSQGATWNDPTWTARRVGSMRSVGLVIGGYHYADNTGDSPEAEARHFVEQLRFAGWDPQDAGESWDRFYGRGKFSRELGRGWAALAGRFLPGVLDIESGTGGYPGRKWVRRFVREYVNLTGHHPIIYTGSFWRYNLGNPIIARRCSLWLAAYTPSPWPYVPRRWRRPLFWQYTDSFHCPGVASPCDGDKFMGRRPRKQRRLNAGHR